MNAQELGTEGGQYDLPQLARCLGMNESEAYLVVPYMWIRIGSSEAQSPIVILMVEHLQPALAELGYPNRGDGYLDDGTVKGIQAVCREHDWKSLRWVKVFGAVLDARKAKRRKVPILGALTEKPKSKLLVWGAVGLGVYLLFGGKK